MTHVKKNLSLKSADELALLHARHLQDLYGAPRLEEEENDDEEEEENDDEEEEDEDEDEDDAKELSAEEARRIKKALKKANKEAAKYRSEAKKLRKTAETDTERAIREAKEAAEGEVETKWKTRFIKSEAKSALIEAGLTTGIDRFVGLLDFDEVEIDDDGDVIGLEDQIKDLKKEFPDLFTGEGKQRKTGLGGKGDGAERKGGTKTKSSAERLAAMATGG